MGAGAVKYPVFDEGRIDQHGSYYVAGVYVIGAGELKAWGVWESGNRLHSEYDTEEAARAAAESLHAGVKEGGGA